MSYKPFLSHRRPHQEEVRVLKDELRARGAGGWKDTDDLRHGRPFGPGLKRAIRKQTGGFIYWATEDTLKSKVICKQELPAGLKRTRKRGTYPFVPVFVTLKPSDETRFKAVLGARRTAQLLDLNGVVPEPRENRSDLARRVARAYVREMVLALPEGQVHIAATTFRQPFEDHDLTLDWRDQFDPGTRTLAGGGLGTIVEALGDLRDALQERERHPEVQLDVTLPLPLAALTGFELRETTQLRVTVEAAQPHGAPLVVAPEPAVARDWPSARTEVLAPSGPHVLAVSVERDLGAAVERYATDHSARALERLHVPGRLDGADIRDLAGHVVNRLAQLHAGGQEKHLVLLGPAALATCVGLRANGTGRTWLPFWDGHEDYAGALQIG